MVLTHQEECDGHCIMHEITDPRESFYATFSESDFDGAPNCECFVLNK